MRDATADAAESGLKMVMPHADQVHASAKNTGRHPDFPQGEPRVVPLA
jgi:hypothetical protein